MNTPIPRDFDAWARLAATDPRAFERQRHRVLEAAIRRAPARTRPRLRGLQWQLDQVRTTSRTPMAACVRMQRMLWEAVTGEAGLLDCLHYATRGGEHPRARRGPGASVSRLRPGR